jgi:hypothetical protein
VSFDYDDDKRSIYKFTVQGNMFVQISPPGALRSAPAGWMGPAV